MRITPRQGDRSLYKVKPMFKTVTLNTAKGDFVQRVTIPSFLTGNPEVILWGMRVFKLHDADKYREVFYFVVPVEPPQAG